MTEKMPGAWVLPNGDIGVPAGVGIIRGGARPVDAVPLIPATPVERAVEAPPAAEIRYTRDDLVALCTDGVVAHDRWRNRDTAGAQRQLGEARALLAAGCDYFVLSRGSLKTDAKTIWVAIEWHGFSHFEDGYGTDDDTYYVPTRARLDQVAGDDWY